MSFNFFAAVEAKLLAIIDRVDDLRDPWQEFTRPAEIRDPMPLADKARRFELALLTNFQILDGRICTYRIPLDLGDQSLWHGIATAMMAFKYSVTHATADLVILRRWIEGLALQQPNGVLVRGVDGKNTQQDASNDQATGHLAGLWWAWKHGNSDEAGNLLCGWAYTVIANDYALTNLDGTTTKFGQLIRGPLTDPLRASLMIAMLGAAWQVTGLRSFKYQADELMRSYGPLVCYAKVQLSTIARFGTLGKTYDTHRAAIHLRIIDETLGYPEAKEGLARTWKKVRKDGNPWVAALCNTWEPSCLKVLQEMSPEDDMTNSEHINSPMVTGKIKWGGEWCALQPLPRHKVARQDFFFQRSMRTMDKVGPVDSIYSGLDFLAAYYLALANGVSL